MKKSYLEWCSFLSLSAKICGVRRLQSLQKERDQEGSPQKRKCPQAKGVYFF